MNPIFIFFIIALLCDIARASETAVAPSQIENQEEHQQNDTPLSLMRDLISNINKEDQKSILNKMNDLPSSSLNNSENSLQEMKFEEFERFFEILLTSDVILKEEILQAVVDSIFERNWFSGISGVKTPHLVSFISNHPKFLKKQDPMVLQILFDGFLGQYFLKPENINTLFSLLKSEYLEMDLKTNLCNRLFSDPDFLSLISRIDDDKLKNISNLSEAEIKDIIIQMVFPKQDGWLKNAQILAKLNAETNLSNEWVLNPLREEAKNGDISFDNMSPSDFNNFIWPHPKAEMIEQMMSIFNQFLVSNASIESRLKVFEHTFPAIKHLDIEKKWLFNCYSVFLIPHWELVKSTLIDNEYFFKKLIKELYIAPLYATNENLTILQDPTTLSKMTAANLEWLYRSLSAMAFKASIKKDILNDSKADITQKMKDFLPEIYANDVQRLSGTIFSDISGLSAETIPTYGWDRDFNVIFNQTGYDEGLNLPVGENYKEGAPLSLNSDTPIGYNIYFPKGEIKAILVQVYGGFEAKDIKKERYNPGDLTYLDSILLSNGIAVITLNLVDLLKLKVFQGKMPESLHDALHASINYFAEQIRQTPTSLASSTDPTQIPLLASLKGKPIYLYGASFGGRTSIRQAELHSDSFDGYMSHDGALSNKMEVLSDLLQREPLQEYLNPNQDDEIKKITKPILILHNFDDNNVNIKQSIDFVKKAKKVLKDSVQIQVLFTGRGSPSPGDASHNKGHFTPTNKKEFEQYVTTILKFMTENGSKLSAVSDWQTHSYNIYANKNYRSATLKQQFISEAFRIFRSALKPKPRDELKDEDKFSPASIQFGSPEEQDKAWEEYYKPLYIAMSYVTELQSDPDKYNIEIRRLKQNDELSDKVIDRALTKQLPLFFDYLNDDRILVPSSVDVSTFLTPQLREAYRKVLLESNDMKLSLLLLSNLYVANPELSSKLNRQLSEDEQKALNEAKRSFLKVLKNEKEKAIIVWKQLWEKRQILK